MKGLLILFLSLLGLFTVATVHAADPASASTVTITVSNRVAHPMLSGSAHRGICFCIRLASPF